MGEQTCPKCEMNMARVKMLEAQLRPLLDDVSRARLILSPTVITLDANESVNALMKLATAQAELADARQTIASRECEIAGVDAELRGVVAELAALTSAFKTEPIPPQLGGGYCATLPGLPEMAFNGDGDTANAAIVDLLHNIVIMVDDMGSELAEARRETEALRGAMELAGIQIEELKRPAVQITGSNGTAEAQEDSNG